MSANPYPQRSSFVDIDSDLIIDRSSQKIKAMVLNQLDLIAKSTKADIFLLMPKQPDIETASFNGTLETGLESRLRCAIYGDMETVEHAKTRALILIDQLVCVVSRSSVSKWWPCHATMANLCAAEPIRGQYKA
jgi:hypothetical protein